jgi:hypothetical protein
MICRFEIESVASTPSRLRRTPPRLWREGEISPLARSDGGVPRRGEWVFEVKLIGRHPV